MEGRVCEGGGGARCFGGCKALYGVEGYGVGGSGRARHGRGWRGEALEAVEGRGVVGGGGGGALVGVEERGVGGVEKPDVGGIAVKHGVADWERQRFL